MDSFTKAIRNIIEDQGWNDETLVRLLSAFVSENGLNRQFTTYLREVARQENDCGILDCGISITGGK